MIKIENTEVRGWEAAVRGMRNPMNSWDKSDSIEDYPDCCGCTFCGTDNCGETDCFVIGDNDLDLMKRLCKAGTDHRKFMRMIVVYADITAPFYFWKEFDTYKVGTVANSCSTMHTIHKKEFTLDDFSHEHLIAHDIETPPYPEEDEQGNLELRVTVWNMLETLEETIEALNFCREEYLETEDKKWWWQIIQLLPTSYNQKRTVMLNYEVLANIYKSRKDHKLDEWHDFCGWIKTLPYSELIIGKEREIDYE